MKHWNKETMDYHEGLLNQKAEKIIRLWNDGYQWLAEFDGPGSEEIENLLGTKMIPTPFLIQMSKEKVIQLLKLHNPEYRII